MYSRSMTMFAADDFKTQLIVALKQYISGFTDHLKHGLTAEDVQFSPDEMSKGVELAQDYIRFIGQYKSSEIAEPLWKRMKEEKGTDPDVNSLYVEIERVFTRRLKIHANEDYQRLVQENYNQRAKGADPRDWNVYREVGHSDNLVRRDLIEKALIAIRPIKAKL